MRYRICREYQCIRGVSLTNSFFRRIKDSGYLEALREFRENTTEERACLDERNGG